MLRGPSVSSRSALTPTLSLLSITSIVLVGLSNNAKTRVSLCSVTCLTQPFGDQVSDIR